MKTAILLFSICLSLIVDAQKNIKIYSVKENGRTFLYAQNNELCPVSLQLNLQLQNMTASNETNRIYVIPRLTAKFRLLMLNITNNEKHSFSYTYKTVYGDVNQQSWDEDYVYDLPFKNGEKYNIVQGYNGAFSHRNENSLDFDMPVGTEIIAAREGVVVQLVQSFLGSCLADVCKKKANYILVYHSDGTFAQYAHIQFNGAKVKVGDNVNRGDVLALSGNTGYTKGPHLHFICFLPRLDGKESLAVKFWTGGGDKEEFLKEGKIYKRKYDK